METGYRATGQLRANGGAFCSATLILPNAIVTAAHCLKPILDGSIFDDYAQASSNNVVADMGSLYDGGAPADRGSAPVDAAIAGDVYDFAKPADLGRRSSIATFALDSLTSPTQEIELDVTASAYDPRYVDVDDWSKVEDAQHDIAIIFLKVPIVGVKPAVIVRPDSTLANPCSYRSIGYGTTSIESDAQERRSAIKCYEQTTADDSDILVSSPTGATCFGDSGGALAFAGDDEPMHLVGVTSRGSKEEASDPCFFGARSWYTGAYAHRAFIGATLERFSR